VGAKRASESGRVGVAGVEVDVAPIVGASGREDAWGFGLSSTFDKAGLGSSLGAGDGRTTGCGGGGGRACCGCWACCWAAGATDCRRGFGFLIVVVVIIAAPDFVIHAGCCRPPRKAVAVALEDAICLSMAVEGRGVPAGLGWVLGIERRCLWVIIERNP